MTHQLEHIFIDEFGDTSLETQNNVVSNYFILAATIVSDKDLYEVRVNVEDLRQKHFQKSEIKSSKVGSKKDNRRIRILNDIPELNVKFYIVAVDKRHLKKSGGLIYKKSFYKFMNGLMYRSLFEVYPNVKVRADEHGYPEFMESFKKYVLTNKVPDLFDNISFESLNSKDDSLIQVSDFIAGTISRIVDETKSNENSGIFFNILQNQIIRIDEWPIKPSFYSGKIDLNNGTELDEKIRELSFNQAAIFVDENSKSTDEQIIDQVSVVQYLLYHFKFINPYDFIFGDKLLSECKYGQKKHYLHSSIIAKLRDRGVIIASCNKGYKIPANAEDLLIYVEQTHSKIFPMLRRLDKANKKITLATKKEIDLLKFEKYKYLQEAIDRLTKKSISGDNTT